MLYLLDANVLIDANRDYYNLNRVPEFWDWLIEEGRQGNIKIPIEIYEELKHGTDILATWTKDDEVSETLLFEEEVDSHLVSRVVDEGYAADLTDVEVEKIGRDPFLIAYALVLPGDRCVVTTEVSKPKKKRANRHIPDVCDKLGIPNCNTFEMLRVLNFRTGWRSNL